MTASLLLAQVPVELSRDEAREIAREELSRQIYQQAKPSLPERVIDWVLDRVQEVFNAAVSVAPGGLTGLIVILVLVLAVAIALRLGLGPLGRRDRLADRRFGAAERTAEEYRREAESLAASRAWKDAVRARFRAIARELEQRGVLEPRPGRTADEISAEAGAVVPAVATQLRIAADLFDEVWYGDRPATNDTYVRLRTADEQITGARLAVPA